MISKHIDSMKEQVIYCVFYSSYLSLRYFLSVTVHLADLKFFEVDEASIVNTRDSVECYVWHKLTNENKNYIAAYLNEIDETR